jgi:hypothetical protein
MRPTVVGFAAVTALLLPLCAQAQSGGFLVKLGSDTIAIERYERSGNTITGSLLRRSPQTIIVRYSITLNPDGTVASYEQSTVRPDGSPAPNAPVPLKMRFTGDSVIREIVQNGQPATLRSAAPKGTLPFIGLSWYATEMQVQAAKKGVQVHTISFAPRQATPTPLEVKLIGADSAEIVEQGFRTGVKLDAAGHIVRGDGSLTTQKWIATPISNPDIATIAKAWAAAQPMGAASTRDTVNAKIGDATLWIDYGRPAKRGREIWGALVPLDTVWRFGANAAAQMRTDRDLDIGGITVPAGFYSLWLLPSAGQSYLIVNSQTGQWGTQHDASKDVARIPLEKHMALPAAAMEERFRVFVQGDMLMMHWDRGGYGVKIRAK